MFDPFKALQYLKAAYNPAVGLLFEAPLGGLFEETYWTMNDSGLAVRALERLGGHDLSQALMRKLQSIKVFGHDAFKNNGWADPFIHAPDTPAYPFRGALCYRLANGVLSPAMECQGGMGGVMVEEANGGLMYDENNYFLNAASRALIYHKQANFRARDAAIKWIERKFWDPVNLGFWGATSQAKTQSKLPPLHPHGFWGVSYSTVKATQFLSVYMLLGEKTGWPPSFTSGRKAIVKELLGAMFLQNGGFATNYATINGHVDPAHTDGKGNMECTCCGVLANIRPADY